MVAISKVDPSTAVIVWFFNPFSKIFSIEESIPAFCNALTKVSILCRVTGRDSNGSVGVIVGSDVIAIVGRAFCTEAGVAVPGAQEVTNSDITKMPKEILFFIHFLRM